ncbi:MAG: Na+/H+ antiporter subunit E [Acidimicrobiales bacterium]
MIRRVATVAWLVVVWVALWGGLTWANVASGIVVSVVLLVLFPTGDGTGARISPWPAVRYVVWFAGQLVAATWQVVAAVVAPRGRVHPGVVAVGLRSRSAVIATLVGNSVTLTPGTLTVDVLPAAGVGAGADVDGDADVDADVDADADVDVDADQARVLLVHALDLSDPEAVRESVLAFEARAVAAFGTEADRAALSAEAVS